MFGGHGLYLDMVFVAIVHNGALFLKTSVHTREKFIEAGMKPFQPSEKQTLKNYYQVPVDILENAEALKEWFLEAKKT
jgi:DNA transformation protein